MKRFNLLLMLIATFAMASFLISCTGDDEDDEPDNSPFIASQADLNSSIKVFEKDPLHQ